MVLGLGNWASPVPVVLVLCTISIWKLAMSGELADAASLQGTPLPLTKQKTVRCYKENIKKDDGKNFEIEKIRKDEDVIETLQQRHSRDTNCVVLTSVSDSDTLPGAKLKEYSGGSVDTGPDIDLPHLSHDMGTQYGGGGGGGSADISLGQDFTPPRLDTGFGDLHDTPHLDIPNVPSVPTDFGSIHDAPKLHLPTHNPPFGGAGGGGGGSLGVPKTGIDTGFGNLQDINNYRSGSTSGGTGAGAGAGAPAEEENVKTYEFATNIKRQESYDHRGFHQERTRVAAPGGGWKTTYRYDGPGGATYETSANDLDHKISAVSGGPPGPAATPAAVAAGLPLQMALLLLLPRMALQLLR